MARIDASKLDLEERVVHVARVSKVVMGGRRFSIRALVVIGDHNGHVGFGMGKAGEYTEAIRKGVEDAKKHLIHVPLSGTTIPYMVNAYFSASEVMLKPASPGTGVIAGSTVRAVMELVGIRDILTKSLGSTNPANTVQACLEALRELRSPEEEAARRGKTLTELVGKKRAQRVAEETASAAERVAVAQTAHKEAARENRNTGRRGNESSERGDRRGGGGNDRGDRRGGGGGGGGRRS